jgi:hypothetical protein
MTTADGSVIGKTQIFGSAPTSHAFNVVLLAEGFTTAQQANFDTACTSFVQAFLTTPPYDGLSAAINIFRVNVRSTDSGADDPTSTGGTGATPRTYFDATFGANGIQRLLVCDDMTALTVATAQVPQFSAVLVVVNSTEYGGSGGSVGVYSLADGATEIALHEMGHTAYGLADEYPYYAGGVEPAQNHYSGPEPSEPNITANSVRASLKWGWAVPATTAIPTMHNPDCSIEDYRPSPVPGGTVGLFEGAGYFHCGAYRPEYDCKMRNLGVPFCRVCRQVIWNDIGPLSTPGGFTSLAPYRLLDTRSGQGALRGAVAPRGTVSLQVAGCGGVPASGVAAVALNVTVAEPTASGYVTVYGGGMTRPTASNLNYVAGQVVPNLVVAPVGAGGKVALFNSSPGSTQLIADVSGYFLSGNPTAAGAFTSLAPARLLDTRSGLGAPLVAVAPGGTVSLQVTGRGNVPASGVSAVVLNVTVDKPTASGYVTVYGGGMTRPTASNLNYVAGQVVPNLVVAPVGAGGKVDLYNGSGGTVQLIADVSGYFHSGAPAVAGAFGPLAPSRLLDTRNGTGAPHAAVAAHGTVSLQVTGRGNVPASGVSAVVLNVTVAEPAASGYVTVYGYGTSRPTASNLNYVKNQVVPNLVVAPVGPGGKVDLYNGSSGTVQLIADVSGYFRAG